MRRRRKGRMDDDDRSKRGGSKGKESKECLRAAIPRDELRVHSKQRGDRHQLDGDGWRYEKKGWVWEAERSRAVGCYCLQARIRDDEAQLRPDEVDRTDKGVIRRMVRPRTNIERRSVAEHLLGKKRRR
jgi:hypothetical protein